jgi:hypothetical protein
MEAADLFIEIVKYSMPAIIAFITIYMIMKQFLEHQLRKESMDIRRLNQQTITPLRLQAYERLVLLMERVHPAHLAMRMNGTKATAGELHLDLIGTIKQEYDHNLTQQIYVSRGLWEAIKKAKEESIKMVNVAASQVSPQAPSIELIRKILEVVMEFENIPAQTAIDAIKRESRTLY